MALLGKIASADGLSDSWLVNTDQDGDHPTFTIDEVTGRYEIVTISSFPLQGNGEGMIDLFALSSQVEGNDDTYKCTSALDMNNIGTMQGLMPVYTPKLQDNITGDVDYDLKQSFVSHQAGTEGWVSMFASDNSTIDPRHADLPFNPSANGSRFQSRIIASQGSLNDLEQHLTSAQNYTLRLVDEFRFMPAPPVGTPVEQWNVTKVEYRHRINLHLLLDHCQGLESDGQLSDSGTSDGHVNVNFNLVHYRFETSTADSLGTARITSFPVHVVFNASTVHTEVVRDNFQSFAWSFSVPTQPSEAFRKPSDSGVYSPPMVLAVNGTTDQVYLSYSLWLEYRHPVAGSSSSSSSGAGPSNAVVGPRIVPMPLAIPSGTLQDADQYHLTAQRAQDTATMLGPASTYLLEQAFQQVPWAEEGTNITDDEHRKQALDMRVDINNCHKLTLHAVRPEQRLSQFTGDIDFRSTFMTQFDQMNSSRTVECEARRAAAVRDGLSDVPGSTTDMCSDFRTAFCVQQNLSNPDTGALEPYTVCRYILDFRTGTVMLDRQNIDSDIFNKCQRDVQVGTNPAGSTVNKTQNASDTNQEFQSRVQLCHGDLQTADNQTTTSGSAGGGGVTCLYQSNRTTTTGGTLEAPDYCDMTVTVQHRIPSTIHLNQTDQDAVIGRMLTSPLVPELLDSSAGSSNALVSQWQCDTSGGWLWPSGSNQTRWELFYDFSRTNAAGTLSVAHTMRLLQVCDPTNFGEGPVVVRTPYGDSNACLDQQFQAGTQAYQRPVNPPQWCGQSYPHVSSPVDPYDQCSWRERNHDMPVDVVVLSARDRASVWDSPNVQTYIDPDSIHIRVTVPGVTDYWSSAPTPHYYEEWIIDISRDEMEASDNVYFPYDVPNDGGSVVTITADYYALMLSAFLRVQPRLLRENKKLDGTAWDAGRDALFDLYHPSNGTLKGDCEVTRLPYYLRRAWKDERELRGAPFSEQLTGMDSFGFSLIEVIEGMYFDLLRRGASNYTLLDKLALQQHLGAIRTHNMHAAPQDMKRVRVDVSYDTVLRYTNGNSTRRRRARRLLSDEHANDATFSDTVTMLVSGEMHNLLHATNHSHHSHLVNLHLHGHRHSHYWPNAAARVAGGPWSSWGSCPITYLLMLGTALVVGS